LCNLGRIDVVCFWRDMLKIYSPAASIHFYPRYEKSQKYYQKRTKNFSKILKLFYMNAMLQFYP